MTFDQLELDLYEEVEYEGDIFTCSGCGAYAGHTGPHLGCTAEGEYL